MDNKKESEEIKAGSSKWIGVVAFLIAVILLTVAIFLSINQEKAERLSKLENSNQTETASSTLSKNINEVKASDILGISKSNNVTEDNEILNISNKNSNMVETSSKSNANGTKAEKNENEINNTNQSNSKKEKKTDKAQDDTKKSEDDNSVKFVKPAEGEILAEFSMDSLIYSNTLEEWITHRGIDIKGEMGSNVASIAEGTITSIKNDPRYGLSITIEHNNGFKSIYSCLLSTEDGLEEGQKVSQGQIIGKMGNSGVFETADGAHLHFELMQNGDYINPEMYL